MKECRLPVIACLNAMNAIMSGKKKLGITYLPAARIARSVPRLFIHAIVRPTRNGPQTKAVILYRWVEGKTVDPEAFDHDRVELIEEKEPPQAKLQTAGSGGPRETYLPKR